MAVVFILFNLLKPTKALGPTFEYPEGDRLVLIEGNSLVAPKSVEAITSDVLTIDDIKLKIRKSAEKYGVSSWLMIELARCESSLRHDGVWGDTGTSYGLFQWKLKSWYYYNERYNLYLDISNLEDQIELTAKVLNEGGNHNWENCFNSIYGSN